ncbi:helix-turn-helix domain-containing protein [Pelomonas sp. V22]|uniref:helix-turn-helix transcriptional regulator n=1 Tax=Pelomonas sp. V22 TaxID=2822139 RepID=UPI0024A90ED1|nr:helix-turn-helix domain-containing protein [Pelomonas sp. V22]MDI4634030.1 helix-turn-helix domain-containing protein [Pelomonas sp. V22]
MNSDLSPVRLLTTPQAAALMGLRPNTLEIWRVSGKGPAYRKLAGRAVRYVETEVIEWLAACRHRNTSEYALCGRAAAPQTEAAQ